MIVKNFKEYPDISNDIGPLFISAFPEDERPPLDIFLKSFDKESNVLYGFYEEDTFIGFTSIILFKDICYIFFLAVSPNHRNKGYGSKILSLIKERYKGFTLLLCYEEVDKKYLDYENRLSRERFYLNNGFILNPLKTNEFGVVFQTARIGDKDVTFEEYKEIFKSGFGEFAVKYLKQV